MKVSSIRVASERDAEAIQLIYAPVVAHTSTSFEAEVPSPNEIANRIKNILPQYPWLVCEVENKVVGYAYASQHRARSAYQWCAEVSVYVDPMFYRQGIGKSLYLALCKTLVEQGYFIAVAGITLPNEASIAIHESLGFKSIGVFNPLGNKFGTWHAVGWWHLELQALVPNPKKPIPFSELNGLISLGLG